MRTITTTLAYRPLGPGSPAHLAMLDARARLRDQQTQNAADCWKALMAARRASAGPDDSTGNVTPDKAKGHPLDTDDLSAPRIPGDGTTGVTSKYSR